MLNSQQTILLLEDEKKKHECRKEVRKVKCQTKNKGVQAFVRHIFID